MYTQIRKKTAVNLITGSLGSGKTTLLRHFLANKPKNEHWAILVNEFGAVGIDGSILESEKGADNLVNKESISVQQIPGGCICCTAQNELKEAIEKILKTQQPDRLLIEPTGLGEPDTLVDLLQSDFFKEHFEVQTVFAVIDCTSMKKHEIEQYTIMQNLFSMADVIVLNKSQVATKTNVEQLFDYAEQLFPKKTAIITTNHGVVDSQLLNQSPIPKETKRFENATYSTPALHGITEELHHAMQTPQNIKKPNEYYSDVVLPGLVTRQTQYQLGTQAIGWIFEPDLIFDWKALQTLFNTFGALESNAKPKRAKGVFRAGKPWMLFQWVNNQTSREYIAYRKDSRVELLIADNSNFNIEAFELALKNCIKP